MRVGAADAAVVVVAPRRGRPTVRASLALGLASAAILLACGETRRPIGDECLRSEDCLSGVCSSRTCVAAPTLVTGAGGAPDEEEPRIPAGEGGADAPVDSRVDGG